MKNLMTNNIYIKNNNKGGDYHLKYMIKAKVSN
jgi:hypothetical protein